MLKDRSTQILFPRSWPDRQDLLLLLVQVGVFVTFQLFWAWSLDFTSVANSEVLYSLIPLITALVGWRVFGQQFDRVFLIGMTIVLIGSISLAANDFSLAMDK